MRSGLMIVLLFALALVAKSSYAQRLIFKSYGMNDGLVHNAVRKIYQDKKGFLWIATWEGLSKYDGHRFTNYSGINGLSNDFINDIIETKNGFVYITCNDGIIYRLSANGLLQKVSASGIVINRLVLLPNNKILALTEHKGIYDFSDEQHLKPAQTAGSNVYYNLASLNDSTFILQSDFSVELLSTRYQVIAEHRVATPVFAESGLLKDSKNRVWVGSKAGLKLLAHTPVKTEISFLPLPPPFNHPLLKTGWIRSIFEDSDGTLWFGTANGLLKISQDGSTQLLTERNGLPANDVNCIYQDREKNIWIGCSRGMARLVTNTSIAVFKMEDGLASANLLAVMPLKQGELLITSDKGAQVYKTSTGKFASAVEDIYTGDAKTGHHSMSNSGANHRYLVFPQQSSHSSFFSPNPLAQYYAFADSTGNYFTHSFSGVVVSNDLKTWRTTLTTMDTRIVMLDTKGNLWAGTRDSGLLRISYRYNNGVPQPTEQRSFLPGLSIRSLYEDSKGNIWVGTRYSGVYCINKNGNIIHLFNQASGLTSSRNTSIAEDKDGAIWLSFYSGLDKLVPQGDSFRVFNFSRFYDFFATIQAMVVDGKHSLWLGTTQGLVHILDGGIENTGPLQTIITSVILGDSTYNYTTPEENNFSFAQNNVLFEFSAPRFTNQEQSLYSYRLLGSQNEEWSPPSKENAVSFARLSTGNYRFEARTLGWNGRWGEPAVFSFRISPPFWLAWWFIGTVTLLIAGLIFLLVRRRIKNIQRNAALKQKLAETEMIALRSQMNPHFIFNCLAAIDNLVQTAQTDKATTYLSRFAKLMRSVLESSKHNLVPFEKDFETLNLFLQLEQFRCSNKFSYELTADEALLHGDYKVPPLIVQPFIENAIHHGLLNKQEGEKKLSIRASLHNNRIKYIITDNGVGRLRAYELKQLNKPEHCSYGIEISTERIHLHNQNGKTNGIRITDLQQEGKAAGTRVEVELKAD